VCIWNAPICHRLQIARVGEKQAAIPRHTEINEITARAILKHLEG